jgi:protein SCO1/2
MTLSGAYLAWRHLAPPLAAVPAGGLPAATVINDRLPLPDFALHHGSATFTGADMRGQWAAVIFGYTSCTDICPTSLAKLKDLADRLRTEGRTPPRMIFVSVDSARDTAARLDAFARAFDANIVPVSGDDRELAALVKHLGVHYERVDGLSPDNYRIDHTEAIFLVDPELRLKAVFSWPQDPAAMAAEYPQLTAAAR